MAIVPHRAPGEFWDLVNIPSRFACCKRARQAAEKQAKARNQPIIVRHNGRRPDPNNDPTRVNHWIWVDGSIHHDRNESGFVDVG
jgi:hypothetical protein